MTTQVEHDRIDHKGLTTQTDGLAEARSYGLQDLKNVMDREKNSLPQLPKADFVIDWDKAKPHTNLAQERFPTEREQVTGKLDKLIDPSLSEADKRTMHDLDKAITSGDSKAFAKAIERFKDDPKELQKFVKMLNDNLTAVGSGTHVVAHEDKVLIMGGGDKAVEISTDGRATVRDFERFPNGLIKIGPQDHHANAADVMSSIGESARFHVLHTQRPRLPRPPVFGDARPTE
jgi:hypothetical protein